jgi:hypothetical protein
MVELMPRSGATPAWEARPNISTCQFGGPDVARTIKPALLAHAEQKRDRRMIELLFCQFSRKRDEDAAAGAVVAAERGLRVIDDFAPRKLRLRTGTQRHRVHVGHEHDSRLVMHRAAAGQIDDEVAGLGRHRDAGIGVVEPDGGRRHAVLLQRRPEFASDRALLSGHALDGEEAHETVSGGFCVDRHDESFFVVLRHLRASFETRWIARLL